MTRLIFVDVRALLFWWTVASLNALETQAPNALLHLLPLCLQIMISIHLKQTQWDGP